MRLSNNTINAIIQSVESCVTPVNSILYLYGSRINENLKGGDIDLLIISKDNKSYNDLIDKKFDIIVNIKKNIGDQKIDLLICNYNNKNAFVDLIAE
jgi:hypothetical protein